MSEVKRELAARLVASQIEEMEGQLVQLQARARILEAQLAFAKLRAPEDVERLAEETDSKP